MFTTDTITVITPATGHRHLRRCLESVRGQTFPRVQHLVVADGPGHAAGVSAVCDALGGISNRIKMLVLPEPTGKDGWNGHRIYGAMPFLVNTEFVAYLDEDNWFDADHLETLVAALRAHQAPWAFSLRKIADGEGNILCRDECESLGNLHPAFHNSEDYLVDTSCYLLPRVVAVGLSPAWYRPGGPKEGILNPDRVVCRALMKHYPAGRSTCKHTVNYTVGNRPTSVKADFFRRGNAAMRKRYPGGLPWETAS